MQLTVITLRRLLLPVVILCFSLSVPSSALALDWEIMVIDSIGDIGSYCDLKIDTLGNMHAVYLDNDQKYLKVISSVGEVWQVPAIVDNSGAVAGHCGIAAESDSTRRISYRRDDTKALWYAGPESMGWNVEPPIDNIGNVGSYCDLKIDTLGNMHAVYLDNDQKYLKVISSVGEVWQVPTIVDNSGAVTGHCGIAVESDSIGRISYRRDDTGALWYAGPESMGWSVKTIYETACDAGRYVSLAELPDYRFGIVFYRYDPINLGSVCFTVIENDSIVSVRSIADYSIGTSPNDAAHVDLAIASDGSWHIAYRNPDSTALYYATADTVVTGIGDEPGEGKNDTLLTIPLAFKLEQNFPNPFNPQTTIMYSIIKTGTVNLSIYDVSGRLVRTLVNELKIAGRYLIRWDARDNRGIKVSSGVYFVHLVSAGHVKTRKVVVLK